MIILTIRTDKPEASIALFDGLKLLEQYDWMAHRELAETLHSKILQLVKRHDTNLDDIQGIACYSGPGSFTGLRIGLTVANALSYGQKIPIVSETGDDWQRKACGHLISGQNQELAMPFYGADVHITPAKTRTDKVT